MKFCSVLLVLLVCLEIGICRYSGQPVNNRRNNVPTKDPYANTFEYYTVSRTHVSKISIPIMIHLDKALTKDLTKEYKKTMKKYFRDILRSVETLFRHPSLNKTVELNLLAVKKLSNSTKKYQMDENVSRYLKSYCDWQGECKLMRKEWYYSVLFTGLDVFYLDEKNKQVRSNTGRSYLRGICSIRNSCSLLKWDSKDIAYVMAHELAHSLGITHDGPPYNQCRGHRYIMGAKYNPHKPATSWSPCNRQTLDKFLKTKHARCLHGNASLTSF